MKLQPRTIIVLISAFTWGCSGAEQNVNTDKIEPTLEITAPDRGEMTEDDLITVRGIARDNEALAGVTINGSQAHLNPDGTFEATLTLSHGVNVIETIVQDQAGNQAKDVRAALLGQYGSLDEKVTDGLALQLNQATFDVLGTQMEDLVSTMDFSAQFGGEDPIYEWGGTCVLRARFWVDDILRSGSSVNLTSHDGRLAFDVSMYNVEVNGRIRHQQACIWANSDYTLTADEVRITGDIIMVANEDGSVSVTIENEETTFENMEFDSSWLIEFGAWIANYRKKLKEGMEDAMKEELPPVVTSFINDFIRGKEFQFGAVSLTLDMDLTTIEFTEQGGTLIADTRLSGGETGMYLKTPSELPLSLVQPSSHALQLALADDLLNQVFFSLWQQDFINQTIDLGENELAGIKRFALRPLLPPVIGADSDTGTVRISVGDLLVDLLAEDGTVNATLAVSLQLDATITAGPTGGLMLRGINSDFGFDILEIEDSQVNLDVLEGLADFLGQNVETLIGDMVGEIQLPSFGGTMPSNPALVGVQGYLGITGQMIATP